MHCLCAVHACQNVHEKLEDLLAAGAGGGSEVGAETEAACMILHPQFWQFLRVTWKVKQWRSIRKTGYVAHST